MSDRITAANPLLLALKALWAGDLSYRMPVDGQAAEVAQEHNRFMDRMQQLCSEHERVTREEGTEGKFGGQAEIEGLEGDWKKLTLNLNSMVGNFTSQIREFARMSTAIASGDFTRKLTVDCRGEMAEWRETLNIFTQQMNALAYELTRLSRELGTEGKFGGQAEVRGASGTWKDLIDNFNLMSANLTNQVRDISEVVLPIVEGNLSYKVTADADGEMLKLKKGVNAVVDVTNRIASDVTRIARAVGTDGELGVKVDSGAAVGTWKDILDSMNSMSANLAGQLRAATRLAQSFRAGERAAPIDSRARGELRELHQTLNDLAKQLESRSAAS